GAPDHLDLAGSLLRGSACGEISGEAVPQHPASGLPEEGLRQRRVAAASAPVRRGPATEGACWEAAGAQEQDPVRPLGLSLGRACGRGTLMRSREARRLIVLTICFLIGLGSLLGSYFLIGHGKQEAQDDPPRAAADEAQPPVKARLVVLIVVDQLRGDLLTR